MRRGRGSVAHSLPQAVSTVMEELIEYGMSHADFHVPVELYQLALEAAVSSGRSSPELLYRAVPHLVDLEERICTNGLTKDVVVYLEKMIARPLAASRLANGIEDKIFVLCTKE